MMFDGATANSENLKNGKSEAKKCTYEIVTTSRRKN